MTCTAFPLLTLFKDSARFNDIPNFSDLAHVAGLLCCFCLLVFHPRKDALDVSFNIGSTAFSNNYKIIDIRLQL